MNYKNPSPRHRSRLPTPVRLGVAAVAACFIAGPVLSNPLNPTVVDGTAIFNQVGSVLTVTNSNGAIINWDKFSINAGETTHFAQTSASSSVLNRVLNDPTLIYGTLSSNGSVWLVNPAGIMVGAGGRVDVAGFVASTLNISNADFLAGRHLFANDGSAQNVINQGEIRTPAGGSVYLIGSNVANEGIITTPGGETILAAGATVSLIDSATPGVKVDITGAEGNATNLGTITAEAGRIGIAGVIVRNSGTLNASSVVSEGGRIFLKASQDAYVDGNGRIVTTGTKGGSVEVLGNRVAVMDNAEIDASGINGGGRIMVGGDYQGRNPEIQNASITYFGPNASLKADATEVGDGGTVIVWADDTTRAYGSISARGGALGGNGGLVETSGKRYLDANGVSVNTLAPKGYAGTWLLDPTDITILGGSGVDIDGGFDGEFFYPGNDTSTIYADNINAVLATSNVTISTSSGYYGAGDIMFDGAASGAIVITNGTASARTLTLTADNDIIFYGGSTTFQTTAAGSLDINFNPAANKKVEVQSGATVTFAGSGGAVAAYIGGAATGRSWENFGIVNLNGLSYIDLFVNAFSTFNNNTTGVLNINSSASWSFVSESSSQAGPINNYGNVNVNGTNSGFYTAWEAQYNQSSTGTLNIGASKFLSMQNADTIYGGVNIGADGRLVISEVHGGARTFYNASISGPGMLDLAQSTSFIGSTMSNGILARSNGALGVPGSGLAFSGDMTFASISDVMFGSGTYNFGNLTVLAGWDGSGFTSTDVIPGAGNMAAAGSISMYADRNISINGGVISDGGNILLGAGGNLNYSGGSINTFGGSLTLGAGGVLDFNTSGGFSSVGALSFAAPVVNVHGGGGGYGISAAGDVFLKAQQLTIGNFDYTGISSGANVTVNAGSLTMRTGGLFAYSGNVDITAGSIYGSRDSLISAGNNITATVAGDIRWNDFSHMFAYNDIFLTLAGASSTLYINDTAGLPASAIETYVPNTVHLTFLSRTSGGVVIDGEATTSTVFGRSGFYANGLPATVGAGLVLAYASSSVVDPCVTNPLLCTTTEMQPPTESTVPVIEIAMLDPTQPVLDPAATTGGTAGTFGGEEGADENGKQSDQAKDEKKDEKPAQKKVAQCT